MAKSGQVLLMSLLYVIVIVCCLVPIAHCVKKPVAVARKEDIPYIKCQVCEKLASQLYHQVKAKQAEISPRKLSEYQIIEIAENLCNLKKQEADWILKIDIVEKGDKLELVEQDSEGQCNSECKTIERACQEVLDSYDTDVAEYLYKKQPRLDSLVNFIKDLTKACSLKAPPVPKDRTPGESFVAKSAKEAEMEKLMKSMEGMPGAPGMKMYSREDLMNQKFGDEDAEDDDDDDNSDNTASKLGKVLRETVQRKKGSKEYDHGYDRIQRIKKGIADAGEKLKIHAQRVSNRLRQWWRSRKTKGSKSGKAEL